jgi:NADPH-dependent F420 reductase
MQIAIIGAGNVGGALARATKEAGHDVVVSSVSQDKVDALVQELGVRKAGSNLEAVQEADVVVLAAYLPAVEQIVEELGSALDGKIVIDPTNPVKPDMSGRAFEDTSGSEIIQAKVPGARVVKAFNTVFASRQAQPSQDGVALDGLVAGDDAEAKQVVMDLLSKIGYRPIDVGPLSNARYLEAMGFLNISLNAANGWPWQSSWKLVGPTG